MFGFGSKSRPKPKSGGKKKKPAQTAKKKAKVPAVRTPSQDSLLASAEEPLLESLDGIGAGNRVPVSATDPGASPDRRKLIEQALQIQKKQAKILDGLDDNVKERLRALAVKKMFDNDGKKN